MERTHATSASQTALEEKAGFVSDGSHLLQEIQLDGRYIYIYTNWIPTHPLAQVHVIG